MNAHYREIALKQYEIELKSQRHNVIIPESRLLATSDFSLLVALDEAVKRFVQRDLTRKGLSATIEDAEFLMNVHGQGMHTDVLPIHGSINRAPSVSSSGSASEESVDF